LRKPYILGSVGFPHSPGIFYTALSQWLGFEKYGDDVDRYADLLTRVVAESETRAA
jgi:hypothetical protein